MQDQAEVDTDSANVRFGRPPAGWRLRLHNLIFGSDARAERMFGIGLVWLISAASRW